MGEYPVANDALKKRWRAAKSECSTYDAVGSPMWCDCTDATMAVRRWILFRLAVSAWCVVLPELYMEGTRPAYEQRWLESGNLDISLIL